MEERLMPELRFPEFSGEWEQRNLGEIVEYRNGNANEKNVVADGKYNLITLNSIDIDGNLKQEHSRVDEADWLLEKHDMVMVLSDIATGDFLGLTDLIPEDNRYVLNQRMGLLRLKTEDNPTYIRTDINYNQRYFKSRGQGSSQQNLRKTDILNYRISLPTLLEQQKISDFILSIDEKLELHRKRIEVLKEYKKGMLQGIFNRKIRFQDDDGEDYPEWEEKKFKSTLSKIIDNRGKTPPTQEEGIPLLEVNSLGDSKPRYSEVKKYVSQETYDNWFRDHIEQGDLLFSTVGRTGAVSIQDDEYAAIAQNIVGFRFENHNPMFMYYMLSNFDNWKKIKRIEMGAVQPSVKVTQMILLKFDIPSLPEQNKIAKFLSILDKRMKLEEEKLADLKRLKKGLIQKMFI